MADNFDKSAILDSFLDEVSAYLPDIEHNLDRLQQTPGDARALEETYRRAHTIGGSAAMMDFQALAQVAQGMEAMLGEAVDQAAPLDGAAIALLRRSHGRLVRLVEGIRTGAQSGDIATEDEADRAAWRGPGSIVGLAAKTPNRPSPPQPVPAPSSTPLRPLAGVVAPGAAPDTASKPSIQVPDWLAAFGTTSGVTAPQPAPAPRSAPLANQSPSASGGPQQELTGRAALPRQEPGGGQPGQDAWSTSLPEQPTGATPVVSPNTPPPDGAGRAPTFSDVLQTFRTDAAPAEPHPGAAPAPEGNGTQPAAPGGSSWRAASEGLPDFGGIGTEALPTVPRSVGGDGSAHPAVPSSVAQLAAAGETNALALSAADELRVDADAVRHQVATLRDVVAALREAAQAMETERTELRGFLDGSSDALDRLEEWAGAQMGLDLRHSPETVRRYLPLSVIWVTATRLKKLVALLHTSGRTLTVTQEQIEETLGELRSAVEQVGTVYRSVERAGGTPDQGFSATVAQIHWQPPQPADAASAPPDVGEAELAPGARAELERHVREELRRELEDEVRDELAADIRRDEEQRLRHEIEIQVRRQVLAEIVPGLGASGVTADAGAQQLPQMPFAGEQAPRRIQVTSELSPEALEVFRDEAQEHVQTITTGIAQLERDPSDAEVLRSIRRAMHTLKGAAGMMGFTAVQDLAHASEDLLERITDGALAFTPPVLSLIYDTSEALDHLVSGSAESRDEQGVLTSGLMDRFAALTGLPVARSDVTPARGTPTQESMASPAPRGEPVEGTETAPPAATTDLSVRLQLSKLDDLVTLFGELLINRSVLEERVDRLNHLVSDSVRVSDRLREVGGQLEGRFEAATLPSGGPSSVLPSLDGPGHGASGGHSAGQNGAYGALEQPREFDELELDRYTEFHRLSRGLSEGVADASTLSHEMETLIREIQTAFTREARLSSDFQDRLLKARLVPLQSLVPRLYRAVRASALKEGKEVEVFVQGGETEVDRKVIEEVEGPLLHLVRNAVNHGIESPEARAHAGKTPAGHLVIAAAYEGNQVVISVRDDGAGINAEAIRSVAIQKGLVDAFSAMSDHDAIDLIFRPGMSTASTVTEESGRGVGLDVVRDAANRLRGSVEVESSPGQGTVFTMKFPISLQIARAVLVRVGQQVLALPMAVVGQIGRLDYYLRVPGTTPAIEVRGERFPLVHLASYLKVMPGPVDDRSPVLLVNAGKHRVALLVDDILSQQEIVSKPLGPHLRDVRGVAGATVLGNGQVVLILELHELLALQPRTDLRLPPPDAGASNRAQIPTAPLPEPPARGWQEFTARSGRMASAASVAGAPASGPLRDFVVAPRSDGGQRHAVVVPSSYVLVVDDSPSVRRVVSGMLKAHGWTVQSARDGVEALDVIARERPAAILLDIEMPRMDGYELMATVRSQEPYRTLPLIVLTSRAAAKHQQRAIQLGADAYIVKPYQDEELLGTISRLVQGQHAG